MSEVTKLLPTLNTYTYLPVTMKQFELLTNDIMAHINEKMVPNAVDGDYMAQILMSVIHSLDRKDAKVRKEELFDRCLVNISRHLTYHVVEEIKKEVKAAKDAVIVPMDRNPDEILPDEVSGKFAEDPPPNVA